MFLVGCASGPQRASVTAESALAAPPRLCYSRQINMQHKELALIWALAAAAAGLSACAGPRALVAAPAPSAAEVNKLIRDAKWDNPAVADILLTDFAIAPSSRTFVVGEPVRLQIRNTGEIEHTFAAPGFFNAVAVRTVTANNEPRTLAPTGYTGDKMAELAHHGVGQIVRLTPHEQELARTTRNPFDGPAAPATPIDFGDLLGDLGALGADPFGLNAPANPFGDIAPPPAPGAAAPANPFDVLGGLAAAPPAPPAPVAAPVAQAAPAVAEGLAPEREGELLADWGPGRIGGLETVAVEPGATVYITLVPVRTGTFAVSAASRLFAFWGMGGLLRIVEKDEALAPGEAAPPAADLALLRTETKAP